MEWKCFFVISAYILTACDSALGATEITNVMLADGLTPNEGRVEYNKLEVSIWTSACGEGLFSQEASVVCRQLGYEGVNNIFMQSPFGQSTNIDQQRLNCNGDEESLADCSLFMNTESNCPNAGGVICYESGYTGCYTYPGLAQVDLQNPCENGLQNLTIPKCVSFCHGSNDSYSYAGLYRGDTCLCGKASTTISQTDKVADRLCSSTCAGRNIERCGGESHIALFNITLYLQNSNRTASPPGCAEPTPAETEGDETTTVSIQSSSTSSPPPSSSSSSPSSSLPPIQSPSTSPSPPLPSNPPPTSPSVPSTDRITMEVSVHSIGLTTTVHAVSEINNPSQSTRELVSTNIYSTFSSGASTQSENCTYTIVSKGVQIGLIVFVVAMLLYAVATTFLLIQLRRKVPTRTEENGPDPYIDLQLRPEAGRTYQEMAITSTASSKKPGERRLPSSNLVYENQNVAQYANKIREGADYETVLTPN